MKLLLLQSVQEHNAHRAGHGQQDKLFEDVLKTFIQNIPDTMWGTMQKPVVKTLRDKFRMMMRARRAENRRKEAASGNLEVGSDVDQLLDDLILKKDDDDLERRKQKDELHEREAPSVGNSGRRN